MKVLFLTHRLPYAPNRGDRIRAYHLLREMSTFADVSLFSLVHDAEEEARSVGMPFAKTVVTARVTPVRNLVRAAFSMGGSKTLTHSLLHAPRWRQKIERLVRNERPDVMLAYCTGVTPIAIDGPGSSLPLVLDMVDVDSRKWADLSRQAAGPRRWIYRREARTLAAFERFAAARAREVLVVNDRERAVLSQVAPDARVRVLPSGVELDGFAPEGPPAAEPTVTFCGVLNYSPNERAVRWFATRVWPLVRRDRPDARFVIVGASPTRAVRNLARSEEGITVAADVPRVQPYLWRSAVSVAPLHVARGLQNKVLEALAAGLPVVATSTVREGLPTEALDGCVSADTPEAFADAVLQLLAESPEGRRRLAERADLSRLSWKERLRPLEGILRDAVGGLAAAPRAAR